MSMVLRAKGVYLGGNAMVQDASLVVEGNRIAWAGKFQDVPSRWTAHAHELDLGHRWLLPGLVNTHVHLEFDSTKLARSHFMEQSASVRMGRALAQAQQLLLSGVTTVRDAGSSWDLLDITDASLGSLFALPRLQLCGPPLTITGGHLHFMGSEVDGLDALRTSVREHQKRGCTAIKIIATGGQMTPGSGPERTAYTLEELRTIQTEAHRLGLPTVAHCLTTDGYVNCMDAGIDSIEHCASFVRNTENQLLQRVYENSVMENFRGKPRFFMNGLSAAYHAFDAVRDGTSLPDARELFLLEQERTMFAIFGKLVDLGMVPVVGTDAGVSDTWFDETYLEMVLMCERGGLSPADALAAATVHGARCLGMGGQIGKLEQGYYADIIGVDSDPLVDIHALQDVSWVMRDAVVVKGKTV